MRFSGVDSYQENLWFVAVGFEPSLLRSDFEMFAAALKPIRKAGQRIPFVAV